MAPTNQIFPPSLPLYQSDNDVNPHPASTIQHGSFGNGDEMAMTATAITKLASSIVFVMVMEIAVETRRSQKVGREAIDGPSF